MVEVEVEVVVIRQVVVVEGAGEMVEEVEVEEMVEEEAEVVEMVEEEVVEAVVEGEVVV